MDHFCFLFLMRSRLFIADLWSPAGKWLTSWLLLVMFIVFFFVIFPCGILGQVWNLIVSFPDLCHLSYFYCMLTGVYGPEIIHYLSLK